MSKVRSDSKLKMLPEERQEQIYAWAHTPKTEDHPGGIQYAREQLAADGIHVSKSTLSAFCAWWELRQRFMEASASAKQVEELLAEDPTFSPEQVRSAGRKIFTLEAVKSGDAKTFVALEQLALERESAEFKGKLDLAKYRLSREKFETETCNRFLDWFKDEKARQIAESGMSQADKIAALRAEYFRDVDALEASGGVKLPD